ncbi:MAG: hypothetical protein JOY71_21160 [Acetobacteraceae bacterium]|nr:hypothetical protein [Acetobacteraceae bacterium]
MGAAILVEPVASSPIRTVPVFYPSQSGIFMAFPAHAACCPARRTAKLAALAIVGFENPAPGARDWTVRSRELYAFRSALLVGRGSLYPFNHPFRGIGRVLN